MQKKMCKVCAKKNRVTYFLELTTGDVIKREVKGGQRITTLRCAECGHEWSYSRKAK